jgi:predicted MFS family arabinose efflux permease
VTEPADRLSQAGRGFGGLLREHDFRLLWIGETTSNLGTAVTTVALPLIAISVLHAGTFAVAALTAGAWLPWVLVGPLAGAWVDRMRHRPVMLVCDILSTALFASIPIAAWADSLTLWQLYVVAIGGGISSVFFKSAYNAYIPLIVAPPDRPEGNGKIVSSASAAQFVGPGLAGLLARAFGAATALLADAVSFVVSAICLIRIRFTEPRPQSLERRTLRQDMADGLRLILRDTYFRTVTIWSALLNLAYIVRESLIVLFLVRTVGVSSTTVGLIVACESLGAVLGSLAGAWIGRRIGTAYGLLLCELVAAPFGLLVPLTGRGADLTFAAVGLAVTGGGIGAGNVIQRTFFQNYCPPNMIGRVSATQQAFNFGTMPIGALIAGAVGSAIGVRATMWIAAVGFSVVGAILYFSPIRRSRQLPTETLSV